MQLLADTEQVRQIVELQGKQEAEEEKYPSGHAVTHDFSRSIK